MADILFVTPNDRPELRYEVNGTLLLATTLLQAGFSVDILHFWADENCNKDYGKFIPGMTERILAAQPKCVSFYTLWPSYHVMLRLAVELKQRAPELIIILGGPHASATAEDTLNNFPQIDYICTGEGEKTIVPFLDALLHTPENLHTIPGLYRRDGASIVKNTGDIPLCDLDALPRWDDSLYLDRYEEDPRQFQLRNYYMPIDAGRGCPYNCTFCCTSHFWKRTYRMKSPERIIADIRFFKEKFGIRSFLFSHDAFTTNRKLVEEVCDQIIEQKLDIVWRCTTRIDCVTEELLLKMKQAGLLGIEVGIETASSKMQRLINKKLDLDDVRSKVSFMLKNKLDVTLFFMYGLPEETREDLNETLNFAFSMIDAGIHNASMAFTHFSPGTEMTEKYLDDLTLVPEFKIKSRSIFGYDEEYPMISAYKRIFSRFYHLHTDVRDNFQYIIYLFHVYRLLPNTARHVRQLYGNDMLKMYEDFIRSNEETMTKDMNMATRAVMDRPHELLQKMLEDRTEDYIVPLRAVIEYDHDLQTFNKKKEDCSFTRTYDFLLMDQRRKLPIEAFSQGQTTILMERKNGVSQIRILDMR